MDVRELAPFDWEEAIRTAFAGMMSGHWHAMPGRVMNDSQDGHTASVQATVKRVITDVQTGARSYEDHPVHPDVPIKFASGGGVTHTFAITAGLEGLIVYANRDFDGWHQSGDTQNPITDRMHGYADPIFIPGIRSDPRKLQAVSTTSSQVRSDDGKHVHDIHPTNGITTKSADSSTPPASPDFSPFDSATTFYSHEVKSASGIVGNATDGGTTHSHGVTHADGAWMAALNGTHLVKAHPTIGAILSALSGAHTVMTTPSGVMLQSSAGISLQCPPGGLSLPSSSVGSSTLSPGAAAQNVGALGGDLSGTLPNPTVVSIAHVDARSLPAATSDALAASAGVAIGGLYRDTSIASGKTVIVMRMA